MSSENYYIRPRLLQKIHKSRVEKILERMSGDGYSRVESRIVTAVRFGSAIRLGVAGRILI